MQEVFKRSKSVLPISFNSNRTAFPSRLRGAGKGQGCWDQAFSGFPLEVGLLAWRWSV